MDMVPDDPHLALEQASNLAANPRLEATRALLKRFPEFAPGHAALAYWLTLPTSGIKQETMSESWTHAQDALRLAPDKTIGQLAVAHVLQRMGKQGEAAPYLERAMNMEPVSFYAFDLAAEMAAAKGQYAEARRLITRAMEVNGFATNTAYYQRSMAHAYMREGKTKEAIALLEESARMAEAAGFTAAASANHVFCGLMLAGVGDKSATMHYAQARKLNGAAGMTHNEVFIQALLGDAAGARAAMDAFAAQVPAGATPEAMVTRGKMLHAMAGMVLLAEKRAKDAVEEFKLADDNAWGVFGLAEAYKALGMKKEMKAQRELFLARPAPGLAESALLPIALVKWRS